MVGARSDHGRRRIVVSLKLPENRTVVSKYKLKETPMRLKSLVPFREPGQLVRPNFGLFGLHRSTDYSTNLRNAWV
jgi:hypothetical protein